MKKGRVRVPHSFYLLNTLFNFLQSLFDLHQLNSNEQTKLIMLWACFVTPKQTELSPRDRSCDSQKASLLSDLNRKSNNILNLISKID